MFYNFKKMRFLSHQIQKTQWIEQSSFSKKRGIKAWLSGVSYPGESCFGGFFIDSLGYDTWRVNKKIRQNMTPRDIILRWVSLAGVSYPGESILPGYHTPGSHVTKFFIISPPGCIPQQVKLTRVAYPGESVSPGYDTPGSHSRPLGVNSHFFKLLHKPLKGQCHKNKCGSFFYY